MANNVAENIPLLMCEGQRGVSHGFTADPSHYKLLSVLGQGWDGAVLVSLCRHTPTGNLLAIKRTNLEKCEKDIDEVQHEVLVTRQLQHENVLPYLATFVNNREVWSITPLMGYGSVRDLLKTHFTLGLPELAVSFILRDVLHALEYIHGKGYVHRSVRASHILVAASGRVCLSGLRYSCTMVENCRWQKVIHQFPSNTVHNLNWLSPEVLQQNLQGYNASSDIYSLGITACEMANGIVPFADMAASQMLLEKLRGATPCLIDSTMVFDTLENGDAMQVREASVDMRPEPTPTLPGTQTRVFSESFHQFIQLCLHFHANLRPSPGQLLTHSFIKQCRKSGHSVPELLLSVSPIVDSKDPPLEDKSVEQAERQLENLCVEEVWTF